MKDLNLAIVVASTFQGENAKPDLNGLDPVYLTPIAGKCPNRNVLAGTVAKNSKLEAGKTYMVKWTRTEDDPEYGAQYNWTNLGEISNPLDVINAAEKLGTAVMFDADKVKSNVEVTSDAQNG